MTLKSIFGVIVAAIVGFTAVPAMADQGMMEHHHRHHHDGDRHHERHGDHHHEWHHHNMYQ